MPNLDEKLAKPGPKRILALDGGGIRGALTLGYLEKFEKILQERHQNPDMRLCDYFDLIGGTSTGSIIAAGLAIGLSAAELKEKYFTLGGLIFAKKRKGWNPLNWKNMLQGESFDEAPLEEALKEVFGDMTMGDERIKTGLCIVTKRIDTMSTWALLNHPKGKYYEKNKDILICDAIRASSAATSYFKPKTVDVGDGQKGVFIDGGISLSNNPSFLLLMTAILKGFPFGWDLGEDKLMIVSVGTGNTKKRYATDEIESKNLLGWAAMLPETFMNDATYFNQMMMQILSDSPTAQVINSEVGDLKQDLLFGKKLITYQRYNVLFNPVNLSSLGFPGLTDKDVDDLAEMSNAENRFKLADIGANAAEIQVKPAHFPTDFDLIKNKEAEKTLRLKSFEIPDWSFELATKKPIAVRCKQMDADFEVATLEGLMRGKAGDYLMIGAQNEMYVCKKEIFEMTYLKV
jgi:uncharacterized protein